MGNTGKIGGPSSVSQLRQEAKSLTDDIKAFGKNLQGMSRVERDRTLQNVSIRFLSLAVGIIQNQKKNDELKSLEGYLKNMSAAIDRLSKYTADARIKAGEKDKKNQVFNWPSEAKAIVKKISPDSKFPTDANDAINVLTDASKSISEKSKRTGTEASKLRSELDAMNQAFSGIIKQFKDIWDKAASGM